jgi:hypothetical protein
MISKNLENFRKTVSLRNDWSYTISIKLFFEFVKQDDDMI